VVSVPEAPLGVVIGQNFGCATSRYQTLVCWGSNDAGQLGTPEVSSAARPVMVTGVAYPVAASAGLLHACALRRDGRVRCWGRSHLGQLGRAAIGEASGVPVTVDELSNVVAISAGARHTCALVGDGSIRCWGGNDGGQLGRDPGLTFSHTTLAVELPR